MPGIIVTRDNTYIGEHICPATASEIAQRQAFNEVATRYGTANVAELPERETCLAYALRINAMANEFALTSQHPAVCLLDAATSHLTPRDYEIFRASCTPWAMA